MTLLKMNIWTWVKEYTLITIGVLLYVMGWIIFLVPNNMIGGGVTGLGSIVQYATGGTQHLIHEIVDRQIGVLLNMLQHCLRDHAGNRKNRSLFRTKDRVVCFVCTGFKCVRKQGYTQFFFPFAYLLITAEQLGKNDAGIAACIAERPFGYRIHDFTDRDGIRHSAQILDCALHRHGHVGSRISVRYGEYIQRVDICFMFF